MTKSQTRLKEQHVKAAREVAPIANWVKPSKTPVTLPTPFKPTFEEIERLKSELERANSEKFQLEKQLASANRIITGLRTQLVSFLKDERS